MTKLDYINEISNQKIDENKVNAVQAVYKCDMPDMLKKIISGADETVFVEDMRILSCKEIINANEDLHVDFTSYRIIPFADCGENDFIIYNYNKNTWALFNIIDEVAFSEKDTLEAFFK